MRSRDTLFVRIETDASALTQRVRPSRNRGCLGILCGALTLGATAGCTRQPPADASIDTGIDAQSRPDDGSTPSDAAPSDVVGDLPEDGDAGRSDSGARPPWDPTLPPASAWVAPAGFRSARVIVHAHSVHSHDACDGEPYVDGGVNEPCLQSFRAALCRTRIDAVFLTEHSSLLAEGPFERAMQTRPGDETETEGGRTVGYRIVCGDGHRVLVVPGAENELMPIALREHPRPLDGRTLIDTYRASSPEAIQRFREAGGFVVLSHAEQKEVPLAVSLRFDGTELYNVHANLDPRIAGPFLGEDIGAFFSDIPRFINPAFGTEPDLLFLGLFRENVPDLVRWSAMWRDGQRVVGVAGSDAHENTIQQRLADGERGDSYRRVFRWFSNELLVEGTSISRASLVAALSSARARVRFEAWGVAEGFQWTVREGATSTLADGASVSLSRSPALEAVAPRVWNLPSALPVPAIRVRILRADSSDRSGWTEVATDPSMARFTPTSAGVYRAEAVITPHHARPYLPRLERYVREVPWVYGAPVRVTE